MNIHIKALLIGFAVVATIGLLCWLLPYVMMAILFIGLVGVMAWMIGAVAIGLMEGSL
jgi:hypothetical protein